MANALGTKIVPARGAAQRASANFAEQLSSDEEHTITIKKRVAKRFRTNGESSSNGHPPPAKRARSSISSDEEDTPAGSTSLTKNMMPINNNEPWNLSSIVDYVFVFLNDGGDVYDPDTHEAEGFIWWPGKVTDKEHDSIKVQLFGKLKPGLRTINIQFPSRHNLVTFTDKYHEPRFANETVDTLETSTLPPPKSSVQERWSKALALAFKQKEEDDDGLPEVGFAFSSYSTSQHAKTPSIATDETHDSDFDPDEPPEEIDPFTIVYAHDRKNPSVYWPARVLEYVPGKKNRKGRWKVQFVDNTDQIIPRSYFYRMEQEEFGLCKLGEFNTQALDDPNDTDDENCDDPPWQRQPSPLPLDPPPKPKQFFELSIREQFSYVKPVLQAILNNKYAPAKQNHDAFIMGGKARQALSNEAGLRGLLPARDADQIHEYLQEWCLRMSHRPKHKVFVEEVEEEMAADEPPPSSFPSTEAQTDPEPEDSSTVEGSALSLESDTTKVAAVATDAPLPQTGCPEYEALSVIDKMNYCLDVLHPEAKRQILLWRDGQRTSCDLLSDEDELTLWENGAELLNKVDWVRDAQRLRASKERQLEKAGKLKKKVEEEVTTERALRAAARS